VAEHLAEPGLVEARHLRPPEVYRLGLVRRGHVFDALGLGEAAGLIQDAIEIAVVVRRVVVGEQRASWRDSAATWTAKAAVE
jgi:hypothetical protein